MNDAQFDSPPNKLRRKRWILQLLFALALGASIHWLWPMAAKRFPRLPEMKAEEVLAILAIAFAVVQFLDARGQEHELSTISGKLQTETANLGTQIGKLQNETANLGSQVKNIIDQANQLHGELQSLTNTLGSEIKGITQQANQLHTELQAITRDLAIQSNVLRSELTRISGDLAQQTSGLKDISGSVSTRFVGAFPENMREIIDLLKNAREKIEIVVDFPGYGQYSALQYHKEYIKALIDARQRKVEIRIICYQLALVRKERLEQFPDTTPEEWAQKISEKKFNDYFAEFTDVPRPRDRAELREALTARDRTLMKELYQPQLIWRFHPELAAFFLWRVDNAEAIFTFKNVGRTDVGLSFRTHDGNLVKQFGDIFERRWNNAKDDYDPQIMT